MSAGVDEHVDDQMNCFMCHVHQISSVYHFSWMIQLQYQSCSDMKDSYEPSNLMCCWIFMFNLRDLFSKLSVKFSPTSTGQGRYLKIQLRILLITIESFNFKSVWLRNSSVLLSPAFIHSVFIPWNQWRGTLFRGVLFILREPPETFSSLFRHPRTCGPSDLSGHVCHHEAVLWRGVPTRHEWIGWSAGGGRSDPPGPGHVRHAERPHQHGTAPLRRDGSDQPDLRRRR